MRRYHYSLDDRTKVGPVTIETLRALGVSGRLQPSHFVFVEGASEWVEAGQIEGVFPEPTPPVQVSGRSGRGAAPSVPTPHVPRPRPPALKPLLVGDYAATPPRAGAMPIAGGLYGPPEACPRRYRAAACVADGAIVVALLACLVPVARALSRSISGGSASPETLGVVTLLSVLVTHWLYNAGMDCAPWRGTPAKAALTMRVVDTRGERITFRRATIRHFAKAISLLPLGAGIAWAWADPNLRTWHDRLSGTVVQRTPPV